MPEFCEIPLFTSVSNGWLVRFQNCHCLPFIFVIFEECKGCITVYGLHHKQ